MSMILTHPGRALAVLALAALAACSQSDPAKFMTSAQAYIAQKNYPAAVIELKNALAAAPDNAQARFLLGSAFLYGGDPVAAATELQKAIALGYPADEAYPLLARSYTQRPVTRAEVAELERVPVQGAQAKALVAAHTATAWLFLGERRDARRQVEAALALAPDNLEAHIALAKLLGVEGNLPEARREIDAVLAKVPDDVDALLVRSEVEIARGDRPAATKTLERIVELAPNSVRAHYVLATLLVQQNAPDRAGAQVDALRKLAPGDPRTMHAVALLAFARDDTAAAVDAVQKSLERAPDYLPARFLSGLIDLKRGAYASAEQSLRTVAAQAPTDDGAATALAQVLLRRGQAAQARDTLAPVLARSRDNVAALRLAGEVALAQKTPAKAADYITRANALDQDNVEGRVRLAQVRMAQGEAQEAVRDLSVLTAGNARTKEADLALVASHLRLHDYPKALAAAEALVRKDPTQPVGPATRGAVYMAMGEIEPARKSFEQALALDPDFPAALYALARIDMSERNFTSARERYQKMLARTPQAEPALLGTADVLEATGAPAAEIVAALERAIAANPNAVASRVALVNYYARQKNWKAALTAAQAAQAAIPDSAPIQDALGQVQQAAGEPNQAMETYTRLSKLRPDDPTPLLRLASLQATQKNYDAALVSLEAARRAAPDNASTWLAQATVYRDSGRMAAGLEEARRLQKAEPKSPAGYALEGDLMSFDKQYAAAAAAYRTAVGLKAPALTVVRLYTALSAQGKDGEAEKAAAQWLAEHPQDVMLRTLLGQRALDQGDYKTSARYLREAVAHEPANAALLNNLAWSLAQFKEPSALAFAERAYRIAPGSAAVANTYGWILVQRGETAEGLKHLRRSMELDANDTARRLYLAKALLQSGDKAEAKKELEIVARTDKGAGKTEAQQLLEGI